MVMVTFSTMHDSGWRMKERKVSEQEIAWVIDQPDTVILEGGVKFKTVRAGASRRQMIVVYETRTEGVFIVTVYRGRSNR